MSDHANDPSWSRRDLLKVAGAALALPHTVIAEPPVPVPTPPRSPTMMGVPFERHSLVKIAIVGTGLRGRSVLSELNSLEGVQVTALCDVVPDKAQRAAKMVTDAGKPEPALYTNGDHDFERLVLRDDIDFVYTATPWPWHTPVMLAAMKAGKHCGTEVPAATSREECWDLVRTSERTRRHCMIMENCCYDFNEMLVNRMVKGGMFGEVMYGEAAYDHDLRSLLFEDRDEGLWRRLPHTQRQGNFYPTHGLGPVSYYFDIHGGDRFDYIVSMSTPERGLSLWREAHVPKDNPKWQEKYIEGDINTSLIKTVKGRTIMLQHAVSTPTPYDRLNSVRGTKGVFKDYPARIYLEGQAGGERYQTIDSYKDQWTAPLWKQLGDFARSRGHGGMDYLMAYRLVQCLREGLPPDIDVYDAAAWSAPWALSEASLKRGSVPVKFDDYTNGEWQKPRARS